MWVVGQEVSGCEEPRVNLQMVELSSSGCGGVGGGVLLPPTAGILSACLASPPPSGDVVTTSLDQLGNVIPSSGPGSSLVVTDKSRLLPPSGAEWYCPLQEQKVQ